MTVCHPPRPCPVCTAHAGTKLFRQTFASLSSGSLLDGFDLMLCEACGAAYADDLPAQSAFDHYYAAMSKYEYGAEAGRPSSSDLARFREIADLVQPHLTNGMRLLDVGCATGGLLAEFKARGFVNVLGVDPSPSCVRLAGELYDVPAEALPIAELHQLSGKSDVLFLTGVLEHVRDVDASITHLADCLETDGLIYIEVPDATRYDHHFSAPYQLLSMEHINYFSPGTLTHLLGRHGFAPVFITRLIRHLSAQAIEPCMGGLFRRQSGPIAPPKEPDSELGPSLYHYLALSEEVERRVHTRIDTLVDLKVPLAVWGTGTHTLRLLKTSRLAQANILAFIDSNRNYQNKHLEGIPILAPESLTGMPNVDILVSSQVAETIIFETITSHLRLPNTTHRLYAE